MSTFRPDPSCRSCRYSIPYIKRSDDFAASSRLVSGNLAFAAFMLTGQALCPPAMSTSFPRMVVHAGGRTAKNPAMPQRCGRAGRGSISLGPGSLSNYGRIISRVHPSATLKAGAAPPNPLHGFNLDRNCLLARDVLWAARPNQRLCGLWEMKPALGCL